MLTVRKSVQNKVAVLSCAGTLDLDGANELKAKLNDTRAAGNLKIILNFREVTNIQSSVLQHLLSPIRAIVSIGGALVFSDMGAPLQKVLKTAMFFPIVKVFETEADAMKWLTEG